jgi:hypothetical protein
MLIALYDSAISGATKQRREIIPIKDVYSKLGRQFSIKKHAIKEYLSMFRETHSISIIKGGIELNYEVVDNGQKSKSFN